MNDQKDHLISTILEENQTILKHLRIGLTRIIILWKINQGPTYGYDLMKTVDEFFKVEIEKGLINKANSSKIYPILKKFEENEIIIGEWEIKNEKRIKVYNITEKGKLATELLKDTVNEITDGSEWENFLKDVFNERITLLKKEK